MIDMDVYCLTLACRDSGCNFRRDSSASEHGYFWNSQLATRTLT